MKVQKIVNQKFETRVPFTCESNNLNLEEQINQKTCKSEGKCKTIIKNYLESNQNQ